MVGDDLKLLDDDERYLNLKEEVGGLIPSCQIFSLLEINLQGGRLAPVL